MIPKVKTLAELATLQFRNNQQIHGHPAGPKITFGVAGRYTIQVLYSLGNTVEFRVSDNHDDGAVIRRAGNVADAIDGLVLDVGDY